MECEEKPHQMKYRTYVYAKPFSLFRYLIIYIKYPMKIGGHDYQEKLVYLTMLTNTVLFL